MPTQKEIAAHHDRVRALGCVVTLRPHPTIHHCHSGSLAREGWTRGTSQRGVSEALVLPLAAEYHSAGRFAIDGGIGVETWESQFGTQMDLLHGVSEQLGYDVFELALKWGYTRDGRKPILQRRIAIFEGFDDPPACAGCGAMAGCCPAYPNCVGGKQCGQKAEK